jgi:hypothetical protein
MLRSVLITGMRARSQAHVQSCAVPAANAYFFRLIRRPGSEELMDTKFPRPSRAVWNLSLVRPVISFFSSRTTADVSLKPVVTEPMIRCLPSRMYFFSSDMLSPCPTLNIQSMWKKRPLLEGNFAKSLPDSP